MGYLDSTGLGHFTAWVKARLSGKQDALTPDGSVRLQGGNIGVALPTKAVTKAEYDALTEAEKQAETVYLVDEPAWEPVPLSIQEYDTEDGWHVRKWSNGYVEMSFTRLISSFSFTSWGGGVNSAPSVFKSAQFPVPLVKKFSETAGFISGANTVGWVMPDLTTSINALTHSNSYSVIRPGDNPGPATICISVTGRWK